MKTIPKFISHQRQSPIMMPLFVEKQSPKTWILNITSEWSRTISNSIISSKYTTVIGRYKYGTGKNQYILVNLVAISGFHQYLLTIFFSFLIHDEFWIMKVFNQMEPWKNKNLTCVCHTRKWESMTFNNSKWKGIVKASEMYKLSYLALWSVKT